MKFSRQEYWSGLPYPPPGDLLNPEIEATPPVSPALQVDSLSPEPSGRWVKDESGWRVVWSDLSGSGDPLSWRLK